MDENNVAEMAKPLHIQRIEALLDMGPFMQYAQTELAQPLTSSEDEEDYKINSYRNGKINKMFSSKKGLNFGILLTKNLDFTPYTSNFSILFRSYYRQEVSLQPIINYGR